MADEAGCQQPSPGTGLASKAGKDGGDEQAACTVREAFTSHSFNLPCFFLCV